MCFLFFPSSFVLCANDNGAVAMCGGKEQLWWMDHRDNSKETSLLFMTSCVYEPGLVEIYQRLLMQVRCVRLLLHSRWSHK